MLSKKMAFSLTSLITILALAFVAPSAIAAFDVTISAVDVMEGGDIEIEYSSTAQVINVSFGEVITNGEFAADDIVITPILRDGGTATAIAGVITAGDPANGKNFDVTLATAAEFTADAADANRPDATTPVKLHILVKKDAVTKLGDPDNKNNVATKTINLVRPEPGGATVDPDVVSITRAVPISHPGGATFVEEVVTGPFQVKIVLTEKPNGGLADGDLAKRIAALDVAEGTVTNVVAGIPFARVGAGASTTAPPLSEGGYTGTDPNNIPNASGRDMMYYTYLATITPKGTADMVTIKVKDFKDTVKARGDGSTENPRIDAGEYTTPPDSILDTQPNGRERLKVKVVKDPDKALAAGTVVNITNKRYIPKDGYLVIATDPDSTSIHKPTDTDVDDKPPLASQRTPAELLYNIIDVDLPDLEAFLLNGGTIDLIAPEKVVISEIMWGSDASLEPNKNSQWIEIRNKSGKELKTGDKNYQLIFYGPNEQVPAKTAAVAATTTTLAKPAALPSGVMDRVGTIDDNGVYWSVASTGQGGRSGHGETKADLTAVVPTQELISMYRTTEIGTDGLEHPVEGNTAAAWMQSTKPSVNIDGANRVGSPGAAPHKGFTPPPVIEEEIVEEEIPVAEATDIVISEVMVDTGSGRLPQWIELNNVSGTEVRLDGWSLMIQNSDADADTVGVSVEIDLSGNMLGVGGGTGMGGTMGKSLLLVAWTGRNSTNLDDNDRVVNVAGQVGERGRYQLISDMAFMIALVPPQMTGVLEYGDVAGNLDAATAWDIPMDETGRSSLIRVDSTDLDGTDVTDWVLASTTGLIQTEATWYGSDEDAGTPGVVGGGPLPVELSHFRPARDKATGAVVITWATQSELNNAGFFIKRSNQRDGEFKVINAAMVPGAGTTSEKQFYTYTDTTAQPNVVYYYQIEDVSLDGNRQTLTRGIRLKGHVGAAGKATVIWGELKASHE